MKTLFVKNLKDGQIVNEVFLLREKLLKDYSNSSGRPAKFLQLELADRTGTVTANCWDDGPVLFDQIEEGDLVKVRGKVTTYKGSLRITVENIVKVSPQELKLADFVPASSKDIEKMFAEIKKYCQEIKNHHLSELLNSFFKDEKFVENYKASPAGKSWHQAYLGGLLEHSLNVVKICDFSRELYPQIHRDLILTAAILHDIGKTQELKYPKILDYTDAGRLLGHISLQDAWVAEKMDQIKGFPEVLKIQLRHLLLSHHGEREAGSPKRPKTLEALVLHFADNLDASAAGFTEIINKTRQQGKTWSEFVKIIDRYLYAGGEEAEEKIL